MEKFAIFKDKICFYCSFDMESNFTENFNDGENKILDLFSLYLGSDNKYYLNQHSNKTIEIKFINSNFQFLELNLKSKFVISEIENTNNQLKLFFSNFLEKFNRYYLELNP